MNNDFIIEKVTPAIARKIMGAMAGSRTYVDPKIITLADQARYHSPALSREENLLAQFIIDHDYRCVIPTRTIDDKTIVVNTLAHLLRDQRAIFMDKFAEWQQKNIKYTSMRTGSTDQYQVAVVTGNKAFENPSAVIENRDSVWVTPLMDGDYQWLARMVPRMIMTGEYLAQESLYGPSIHDNNAVAAAIYLTPAYGSIPPKLLISMKSTSLGKLGIYSRFIEEKPEKNQK